jgi:hypothetical protein
MEADFDGIFAEPIPTISHKIGAVARHCVVTNCFRPALVTAARNHKVPRSNRASPDFSITFELNFRISLFSLRRLSGFLDCLPLAANGFSNVGRKDFLDGLIELHPLFIGYLPIVDDATNRSQEEIAGWQICRRVVLNPLAECCDLFIAQMTVISDRLAQGDEVSPSGCVPLKLGNRDSALAL